MLLLGDGFNNDFFGLRVRRLLWGEDVIGNPSDALLLKIMIQPGFF
jgi:hypothetical protein